MVQRVPAPAEHYLIVNGTTLVSQLGGETLSKFAMERILENRITSRNFKAGLDFTDAARARSSRTKLVNMFINFTNKEFSFIDNEEYVYVKFVRKHMFTSDQLVITTIFDQSVIRYINRINKFLTDRNIPIRAVVNPHNDKLLDKIEITFGAQPSGGRADQRSTLHYYKLMCFIPEIQGMLRALARKACYKDKDAKAISRSKFSGWVGVERPERNTTTEESSKATPSSTKNVRGGRQADRSSSAITESTR